MSDNIEINNHPWEQPTEQQQPASAEESAGKISYGTYLVLMIITAIIAIPILFYGAAITLMSPMLGDSGESVETYVGMFLIPIIFLVLPIIIFTKIIKKLRKLYKPYEEEKKKEIKTSSKLLRSTLIAILIVFSPLIIWAIIITFWNVIKAL